MRATVKKPDESHSDEQKPLYRAECEECGKEITFSKADITHGAYGCVMVNCPSHSV